jgi:hypothetical protein
MPFAITLLYRLQEHVLYLRGLEHILLYSQTAIFPRSGGAGRPNFF